MTYYKVKDEYDNFRYLYLNPLKKVRRTLVGQELYTEKEKNRIFPTISDSVFVKVNISKNKTYWAFGARFERMGRNVVRFEKED